MAKTAKYVSYYISSTRRAYFGLCLSGLIAYLFSLYSTRLGLTSPLALLTSLFFSSPPFDTRGSDYSRDHDPMDLPK